ncbi:MAG: hypothetical protein V1738_03050 [Patescibacteria group bacterium]
MDVIIFAFLMIATGYLMRRIVVDQDLDRARQEAEADPPALPPSANDSIPLLPPAVKADAIVPMVGGNGPYRDSQNVIAFNPLVTSIGRLSFSKLVSYCQVIGLPVKPEDSAEFIILSRLVDFGSPEKLCFMLHSEINHHLGDVDDEPELVERLVAVQTLLHVVAIRNSAVDAELLDEAMKTAIRIEAKLVFLKAIGQVWPVTHHTLHSVATRTDYWRADAPQTSWLIQRTAEDIVDDWRERDPQGFIGLSRQLLNPPSSKSS